MIRAATRTFVYQVPGEAEQCPACGSPHLDDLDVLQVRRPGRGVLTGFVTGCDDCGVVFSNPLPSVDELHAFYSPSGEWRAARQKQPRATDVDSAGHGRSWSKPFNAVRGQLRVWAPPPGSRVLDFGCGEGKLLDAFQEHGWETWGIEPAVDAAFSRHGRLQAVPDRPTFDMIVANHVLEHITDPLALLRRFAAASREDGYLFVSVPRFDTLPLHRDYGYVINGRAHVMGYTSTCLEGLLARAGWTPAGPVEDRVPKGRGKTTRSRLRMIARRAGAVPPLPTSPLSSAQEALRLYYRETDGRSILARLGLHRCAARVIEMQRRRRLKAWKSSKKDLLGITI